MAGTPKKAGQRKTRTASVAKAAQHGHATPTKAAAKGSTAARSNGKDKAENVHIVGEPISAIVQQQNGTNAANNGDSNG